MTCNLGETFHDGVCLGLPLCLSLSFPIGSSVLRSYVWFPGSYGHRVVNTVKRLKPGFHDAVGIRPQAFLIHPLLNHFPVGLCSVCSRHSASLTWGWIWVVFGFRNAKESDKEQLWLCLWGCLQRELDHKGSLRCNRWSNPLMKLWYIRRSNTSSLPRWTRISEIMI